MESLHDQTQTSETDRRTPSQPDPGVACPCQENADGEATAAGRRYLEAPADERKVARYFTLGPDELAEVMNRRGDANRLGYALVLLYLRRPGRVLEVGEAPPGSNWMRCGSSAIETGLRVTRLRD